MSIGFLMQPPPQQPVISTSQKGGVTAWSINNLNYNIIPPVTDQERLIALERLNLTLADLAVYRERPEELGQLTMLEQIRSERIARRLYIALSNFFDPTIAQTKHGSELIAFKKRYNLFARRERANEASSLDYIGQHGPTRFSDGWNSLLQYMILRSYRGSKEAVIRSGLMMIEASPDQAEMLYTTFVADQNGGAWLYNSTQELETLIGTANKLLEPYEHS